MNCFDELANFTFDEKQDKPYKYKGYVGKPAPKPPNPKCFTNRSDLIKARCDYHRERRLWRYANTERF